MKLKRRRDPSIPQRPIPQRLNPQRNQNAIGNVLKFKKIILLLLYEER